MSKPTALTLVSWIGQNDLNAASGESADEQALGPIASTLSELDFDEVHLLYNYPDNGVQPYLAWLKKRSSRKVNAQYAPLTSPVNYGEIYEQADQFLAALTKEQRELAILISPGTPAMQAVWVMLGKTRYPCRFYQSSKEDGVSEVNIPFELSAEYIPAAQNINAARISQLASSDAPVDAAFDDIITRNPKMQTLKAQAQVLAEREVPVLIYGETGTGKELFARAIHNASARSDKPFIAVNCGAIPTELMDSVLFGHKRGAFTGATADKPGVFQQAHGGSLFLDEFGELEPSAQVRLLRVLQEQCFVPVGGTAEVATDVRLITATHRNLMEAVGNGEFREDLFYRIAVGVLHLLPLREREGDLSLLTDALLSGLGEKDIALKDKIISPEARNIVLGHPWRGNVRELQSTLLRAALWSQGETISAEDIRQAIFRMPEKDRSILDLDVSQGIDIQEVMGDVARVYVRKALDLTNNNKTHTAKLLGLKNYQTLNNWMEKYQIS